MCLQYFTKVIVVPRSLALRCSSAREYKSGGTPLQTGGMVFTDNHNTDPYEGGASPATSDGQPTAAARADDLQCADDK